MGHDPFAEDTRLAVQGETWQTGSFAPIRFVTAPGTRTGTVNAFCIRSTATVGTIEFESGLQRDLPEILDNLIPLSRSEWPRANMARRQLVITSAGLVIGAFSDCARCRGEAGAWNGAANVSS